ncbi:MAG: YihY/virulence factor BrkB family protein [Christensenellales bacterium]
MRANAREIKPKKFNVKQLGKLLWSKMADMHFYNSSIIISYYLLLSLFPLVLVLGTLLPFLGIDPGGLTPYLEAVVPESLLPVLEPLLQNLLTRSNTGLLSVGAVVAVWSASRGIHHLQEGMNRAYEVKTCRSFLCSRLVAIVTLLLVMLLIIAFTLLFGFGEFIVRYLGTSILWLYRAYETVNALKWPVSFMVFFALLTLIYFYTPNVRQRIRHVLPGSVLACAGCLLLAEVFAIYVQFSTGQLDQFGPFKAFFLLMLWLILASCILLFGACVNAAVYDMFHGKPQMRNARIRQSLTEKLQAAIEKMLGITRRTSA